MMNLDDIKKFKELDSQDMLRHIQTLPAQIESAYQFGLSQKLPEMTGIQGIVIAGMGGSAIGADLAAAYAAPLSHVPVSVSRDYDLPAWVRGSQALVIASSHSGNTEETLSAFEQAVERGCQVLVITRGGKLLEMARQKKVAAWVFQHDGQPRAAVGLGFALVLAALHRLGFLPDPSNELERALKAMRKQQMDFEPEIPVFQNAAKRMAGQLYGRFVSVLASGYLAPVARRWKGQISEVAKAWAQFEALPEADHNSLAGVVNPPAVLDKLLILFLRSSSDHPRNYLRSNFTRQVFMEEGINTDFIEVTGKLPMEHIWTALHYGDYVAYYLAMAYGVDPTPVAAIENLKLAMKG